MRYLILAIMVAGIAACSRDVDEGPLSSAPGGSPAAPAEPPPPQHHARLEPTQGNDAKGEITLTAHPDYVEVGGQVTGLKPNTDHGFHIHAVGDCSAPDAGSAGDHFNPTQQPHGKAESGPHHAGDMDNIRSNESGTANVNVRAIGATLGDHAATDVVGKAIVLHEKADDYQTQPSGDSGARIACAVIE